MRISTAILFAGTLLLASCDESTGPAHGRLRIITVTTGGDFDDDGYADLAARWQPGRWLFSSTR